MSFLEDFKVQIAPRNSDFSMRKLARARLIFSSKWMILTSQARVEHGGGIKILACEVGMTPAID